MRSTISNEYFSYNLGPFETVEESKEFAVIDLELKTLVTRPLLFVLAIAILSAL